jgi:hypothetical protein
MNSDRLTTLSDLMRLSNLVLNRICTNNENGIGLEQVRVLLGRYEKKRNRL